MKKLRLKNFRCLSDTEDIEIMPLTFFVGDNGSGKSSVLNFFSLLRQGAVMAGRGAGLWGGSRVGFKGLSGAVMEGAGGMEASMEVEGSDIFGWKREVSGGETAVFNISFTIYPVSEGTAKFGEMAIRRRGREIRVSVGEGGSVLLQAGSVKSSDFDEEVRLGHSAALLPSLVFKRGERETVASTACMDVVKSKAKAVVGGGWALNDILGFGAVSEEELRGRMGNGVTESELDKLFDLAYYYNINNIIGIINASLERQARGITCIGADGFSSAGYSLAVFLESLGKERMDDLCGWLFAKFGLRIGLRREGCRVQAVVCRGDGIWRDIADAGSGYACVLPTLVGIWKALRVDAVETGGEHIVTVEQPERCLHPRLQAKIAAVLCDVINEAHNEGKDIRFVIETHSKVIINKIGGLIAEGKLDNNDVNVYLFNGCDPTAEKNVELATYSQQGYLNNWPIGFFAEDDC